MDLYKCNWRVTTYRATVTTATQTYIYTYVLNFFNWNPNNNIISTCQHKYTGSIVLKLNKVSVPNSARNVLTRHQLGRCLMLPVQYVITAYCWLMADVSGSSLLIITDRRYVSSGTFDPGQNTVCPLTVNWINCHAYMNFLTHSLSRTHIFTESNQFK